MKFVGHTFRLLDGKHRWLGKIEVEQLAGNLISGSFVPGPDFSAVAEVFQKFEEAVNAQALTVVDQLDAEIAALGLWLSLPNNVQCIKIQDVQIWQDGAITCRVGDSSDILLAKGVQKFPANGKVMETEQQSLLVAMNDANEPSRYVMDVE